MPVYLGAPNVADFAPGRRCFIDAADFAGPRELAEYLRTLGDDGRYGECLAWKAAGLSPSFLEKVEAVRFPAICRLCLKARARRSRAWRIPFPLRKRPDAWE